MISMDPLERSERATELLRRTTRSIKKSRLGRALKAHLLLHINRINTHLDQGDIQQVLEETITLTETLLDEMNMNEVQRLGTETPRQIGGIVIAVRTFKAELSDEKEEIVEVFLVVCAWCLGNALKD